MTLQNHIRKLLMKEIKFDKVSDLDCIGGYLSRKYNKIMKKEEKNNSLICYISRYRYLESKFNKYYKKFEIQYTHFNFVMLSKCEDLKDKEKEQSSELKTLGGKSGNILKLPMQYDYSLCQNYESITQQISDKLEAQLSKKETELNTLKNE